jgi:hypothetical protein
MIRLRIWRPSRALVKQNQQHPSVAHLGKPHQPGVTNVLPSEARIEGVQKPRGGFPLQPGLRVIFLTSGNDAVVRTAAVIAD